VAGIDWEGELVSIGGTTEESTMMSTCTCAYSSSVEVICTSSQTESTELK